MAIPRMNFPPLLVLVVGVPVGVLVAIIVFINPTETIDRDKGSRLLLICLAICFALSIKQINENIVIGSLLTVMLMVIGFSHPLSALFVMGASQIVPEPAQWPITLAQLCIPVFVLSGMVADLAWRRGWRRYRWPRIQVPKELIKYLVPLILWLSISAAIHGDYVTLFEVIKGGLFAVIGWNLIRRINSQRDQILIAICIGGIVALSGYWGDIVGVAPTGIMRPVSVRGFERIGAGRGDTNNVGPSLSLALVCLIGLTLLPHHSTLDQKTRRRLVYVLVLLLSLGVPALAATMSRGGIAQSITALSLSLAALLMVGLWQHWAVAKSIMTVVLVGVTVGLVLWSSGLWEGEVLPRATALWEFQVRDAQSRGTSEWDLASGRRIVWKASWRMITDSPLVGMSGTEGWIRYGPAASNCGHNVLLDAGRSAGFPGMLLLLILILSPFLKIVQTRRVSDTLPTILAYVCILFAMMQLSIIGDKRFWLLWAFLLYQLCYPQEMDVEDIRPLRR